MTKIYVVKNGDRLESAFFDEDKAHQSSRVSQIFNPDKCIVQEIEVRDGLPSLKIKLSKPNIHLAEMYTEQGEHEGFSIKVNGANFGMAILVYDTNGNESYNILSGVGSFSAVSDDQIMEVLQKRISFLFNILT